MKLRDLLMVLCAVSLLLSALWVFLLFRIDPVFATRSEFLLFYLTFLLALTALFTSGLILVRHHRREEDGMPLVRLVQWSFRQGCLFALLVTISLFLLSRELLSWWTSTLLITLFGLVELFFQTKKRS